MLKAFRRCPTPLRWRVVHSASPSVTLRFLQSSPALQSKTTPVLTSTFVRSFHHTVRQSQNAAAAHEVETEDNSGPATLFSELGQRGLVSPIIIDTITRDMGLKSMTDVQSLTLNEALKGKDVLAQAKTGTGKTIGFLLPVLQNIISADPSLLKVEYRRRGGYSNQRSTEIRALVISPTRELAEQIAVEAKRICARTGVKVQTAVGGTQKRYHLGLMQREGCHILVGTPGRIKDILSDDMNGITAPECTAFVLDEADRLLDQGFWPEIQDIQQLLPDKRTLDRQTLMFSATVPREVVDLARTTMKPDLHYVRTVDENETPTHEKVPQYLTVVPSFENQLPAVLELCDREILKRDLAFAEWRQSGQTENKPKPFKAIVYYNATAETALSAGLLLQLRLNQRNGPRAEAIFPNTRIFEIHGRLTQQQRTAAADQFRASDSAILMSSDVTARGMDFPGVTHIIQVGLAASRDTYIHRLGRTGRAGAEGEGWLIVPAAALSEARARLGKLPLQRDTSLDTVKVDFMARENPDAPPEMPGNSKKYFDVIKEAAKTLPTYKQNFNEAFLSCFGTWQWLRNKEVLVDMLNSMAVNLWGLDRAPDIPAGLRAKLGLGGGGRSGGGRSGGGRSGGFGDDRGGFGGGRSGGGFGDRSGGRGGRGGGIGGGRSVGSGGGYGGDRGGYGDRSSGRSSYGGSGDRSGGFSDRSGGRGGYSDRSGGGGGFSDRSGGRSYGVDRDGGRSGGLR